MSEQIREQVSAFLDGELPKSETELLLKRLTRDAELRQSFGRYALIGESLRGAGRTPLSREFAGRVNSAIDGEPAAPSLHPSRAREPRWWKPMAGAAVAAGVAVVAVVALQQRAIAPGAAGPGARPSTVRAALPFSARNSTVAQPTEAISYTVPAATEKPPVLSAARLTSYVFAHSKYSLGLGQSTVMSGLLSDADDAGAPIDVRAVNETEARAAVGATVSDGPPQPSSRDAPITP
jgi:sigma-E factor negative regulatory protein RseA